MRWLAVSPGLPRIFRIFADLGDVRRPDGFPPVSPIPTSVANIRRAEVPFTISTRASPNTVYTYIIFRSSSRTYRCLPNRPRAVLRASTPADVPPRHCCTRWCRNISRPSARSVKTTGKSSPCQPTPSASFAAISNVASSLTALPGHVAMSAVTIFSSLSRVKVAVFAPLATRAVWSRPPLIWSTMYSPSFRCASGWSLFPNGCATFFSAMAKCAVRPCALCCGLSRSTSASGVLGPAPPPGSERWRSSISSALP